MTIFLSNSHLMYKYFNMKEFFYCLLCIVILFSCTVKNTLIAQDDQEINLSTTGDNTAIIQAYLDKYNSIVIPSGVYNVNGTIIVKTNQRLVLQNNVTLQRPRTVNSTKPVVYLQGSFATVSGMGASSIIRSFKNSPNGVVCIGHANLDDKFSSSIYNTFDNIRIIGMSSYGDNDKTRDIGVWIPNAQLSGANYFNIISNLFIEDVDIGIQLDGNSNANSISTIQLTRVGNEPNDYGILINGGQENRIYDVFHHFSPDVNATIGLKELSYKGKNYEPNFNYISAVISEPSGYSSCLEIEAGRWNYFSVVCNNSAPDKITVDMLTSHNTLIRNGALTNERIVTSNTGQYFYKAINEQKVISVKPDYTLVDIFGNPEHNDGFVPTKSSKLTLNRNISKNGIFQVSAVLNFKSERNFKGKLAIFINDKLVSSPIYFDTGNNETVKISEIIKIRAGERVDLRMLSLNGTQSVSFPNAESNLTFLKISDLK